LRQRRLSDRLDDRLQRRQLLGKLLSSHRMLSSHCRQHLLVAEIVALGLALTSADEPERHKQDAEKFYDSNPLYEVIFDVEYDTETKEFEVVSAYTSSWKFTKS
jgi:hypothetical protein